MRCTPLSRASEPARPYMFPSPIAIRILGDLQSRTWSGGPAGSAHGDLSTGLTIAHQRKIVRRERREEKPM